MNQTDPFVSAKGNENRHSYVLSQLPSAFAQAAEREAARPDFYNQAGASGWGGTRFVLSQFFRVKRTCWRATHVLLPSVLRAHTVLRTASKISRTICSTCLRTCMSIASSVAFCSTITCSTSSRTCSTRIFSMPLPATATCTSRCLLRVVSLVCIACDSKWVCRNPARHCAHV